MHRSTAAPTTPESTLVQNPFDGLPLLSHTHQTSERVISYPTAGADNGAGGRGREGIAGFSGANLTPPALSGFSLDISKGRATGIDPNGIVSSVATFTMNSHNSEHDLVDWDTPLTPPPPSRTIVTNAEPIGGDFLRDSFPADTAESEHLRDALRAVMDASWKLKHTMEPHESLLLEFMGYNTNNGKWYCLFSKNRKPCNTSTHRRDQAKDHIRWHIDHRPFFCKSPCLEGENCDMQYTSMDSLKRHRNSRVTCEFCGSGYAKGNIARHKARCRPGS